MHRHERALARSTRRRSRPVARTMARRACALIMAPTTTRGLWSIRTVTGSKPTAGKSEMASIRLEMALRTDPAKAWDAVRDVGAIHTRLAPDFVTDVKMEGDARVV